VIGLNSNKQIVDQNGLTEEEFLKSYDAGKYERPSVTNDIIIFTTEDKEEENPRKMPRKGMQVLLIKRKEHPFINMWATPGGFVRMDESVEDGLKRELKEETGIDNVYTEQLGTFGDLNRDPRTRIISIANLALIPKYSVHPVAGDDAKEVAWFWLNKKLLKKESKEDYFEVTHLLELECIEKNVKIIYEVKENISKEVFRKKTVQYKLLDESTEDLAFDHYKIIDCAIERIREKVEEGPIAFNLLPKLFVVKELQYVYEAILGRELLNFRRKMGNMIIETEEKIEGKPFRPAQVFKFNEEWEKEF
jgi:ADP-ribose pyrophosphatase YjhB (NUDIX family)